MVFDIQSRVKDDLLSRDASNKIREFIKANNGKVIEITLKTLGNTRSTQQDRYYFGCALKIIQQGFLEIGEYMTIDMCHNFVKSNTKGCWRTITHPVTGEMKDTLMSSADHTTVSWENWMIEVVQLAWDFLGVYVPPPNIDWRAAEKEEKQKQKLLNPKELK